MGTTKEKMPSTSTTSPITNNGRIDPPIVLFRLSQYTDLSSRPAAAGEGSRTTRNVSLPEILVGNSRTHSQSRNETIPCDRDRLGNLTTAMISRDVGNRMVGLYS